MIWEIRLWFFVCFLVGGCVLARFFAGLVIIRLIIELHELSIEKVCAITPQIGRREYYSFQSNCPSGEKIVPIFGGEDWEP